MAGAEGLVESRGWRWGSRGRCWQPCVPTPGTTFPGASQSLVQWCHTAVPRWLIPVPLPGHRSLDGSVVGHGWEASLGLRLLGAR